MRVALLAAVLLVTCVACERLPPRHYPHSQARREAEREWYGASGEGDSQSAPTENAKAPSSSTAAPVKVLHGKASYYHDSLAGNLTANGETYRLNKLTAASLTLPFCTRVRVVRKDTGASVIVHVNDRGPYGNRGRILDLSRAAAEELDMIRKGVAEIRAEILELGDGCTFHHRHR